MLFITSSILVVLLLLFSLKIIIPITNNMDTNENYLATKSVVDQTIEWIPMEISVNTEHSASTLSIPERINYQFKDDRPLSNSIHTCTFHLMGKESNNLDSILLDISNPKSANYGKHYTKEQLDELTVDKEGMLKIVEFLNSRNLIIKKQTSSSIIAEGSIEQWEDALHTTFYNVEHTLTKDIIYRAHHYSLPNTIVPYVRFVSNTIHLPVQMHHGPVKIPLTKKHFS